MSRPGAALRAQPLPPTSDLPSVVGSLNNLIATLRHDLGTQVLYQSVSSPAQLTGNQNNYAIGSARVVRLSSDASRTITGFRGGVPNQELTLINVGAQNIVLAHQSGSSDAANRFLLEAGANLTLTPDDAVTLYYDQATARWRNYAQPVSSLSGTLAYAQLPTGNGSWDTGAGTTITITRGFTVSGLLTGNGGVTVASGQTLTLTGATVTGLTAASVGAGSFPTGGHTFLGTLTVSGLLTAQLGLTVSGGSISASGIAATVGSLTSDGVIRSDSNRAFRSQQTGQLWYWGSDGGTGWVLTENTVADHLTFAAGGIATFSGQVWAGSYFRSDTAQPFRSQIAANNLWYWGASGTSWILTENTVANHLVFAAGGAATFSGAVSMGALTATTIGGTTITGSTRLTAPLIGTTSAVDVVFDRNSITQLTLGSLLATFAGTLLTADGSVSAPAYGFSSDTDVGPFLTTQVINGVSVAAYAITTAGAKHLSLGFSVASTELQLVHEGGGGFGAYTVHGNNASGTDKEWSSFYTGVVSGVAGSETATTVLKLINGAGSVSYSFRVTDFSFPVPGAIAQSSTTGALPVIKLTQSDVSEEFVRFIGTAAAATLTQSIVAEGDVTTATRAGFVKVYVQDDGNQITDQAYFMPIYTLA